MFWAKLNNTGVQGELVGDFSQESKNSSIVSLTQDVDPDCDGIVVGPKKTQNEYLLSRDLEDFEREDRVLRGEKSVMFALNHKSKENWI